MALLPPFRRGNDRSRDALTAIERRFTDRVFQFLDSRCVIDAPYFNNDRARARSSPVPRPSPRAEWVRKTGFNRRRTCREASKAWASNADETIAGNWPE